MSDAPLLVVENLSKSFALGTRFFARRAATSLRAVDGVSFVVSRGETFGIVGESGSGKSTLARLILRLIEASDGVVRFHGEDLRRLDAESLRRRRRGIQMVFQDPFASLNPRLSIRRQLAEPIRLHGLATSDDAQAEVVQLLAKVGLRPEHAARYPHEFSGGQRQRIAIARALAARPDLIIADEAVSALDVSVRAQILNLLDDIKRDSAMAMIFISHDLGVVRHLADRVAVMYRGRIVELAPTAALFARPRHPYTRRLLEAMPIARPNVPRAAARTAAAPLLEASASGCAYAPRCPMVAPACLTAQPDLKTIEAGHASACLRAAEVEPPAVASTPVSEVGGAERIRRLQARFHAVSAGDAT